MRAPGPSRRSWNQTFAFENRMGGGRMGQLPVGLLALQLDQELLGAPVWPPTAQLAERRDQVSIGRVRTGQRSPGVIGEPGRPILLESGQPLVGDRSRDLMAAAELAQGKDAALDVANEPQSCVDPQTPPATA